MRLLPSAVMFLLCVHNLVRADRLAEGVARQWEGKQMPRYIGWVAGTPPSASHVRKVSAPGLVLFGASLVIGLATL